MPQVSLVALYGPKRDAAFAALVESCQQTARDVLADGFTPYAMEQVHATIVGLERLPGPGYRNAAFAQLRDRGAEMDLGGYLHYLRTTEHLPLRIQVGGFEEGDTPFLSQGKSPFERSAAVHEETTVLVGWPVMSDRSTKVAEGRGAGQSDRLSLDGIRREAQRHGILHRYHQAPADIDNDFFFRIGLVHPGVAPEALRTAERRLRDEMAVGPKVVVEVGLRDLMLVAYTDTTLPPDSTAFWPLSDAQVDEPFAQRLYGETP